MNFGDLRGTTDFMITLLKRIDRNTALSELPPIASTSTVDPTVTIPAGYHNLVITKTNAIGTVVITFPDTSTYTLTADGEVFTISGRSLGSFTIALTASGTFKYYAY